MYSNPSHGGNTGARWAELQRQEADVVAALQAELKAAQATIKAQKETLDAFQEGSYVVISADREHLGILPEGCLTKDRALQLAERRAREAGGDATKVSIEVYHVTALGHVNFVQSVL